MKKSLLLLLIVLSVSCQSINNQPKITVESVSETYQKPYDSVLKKILEYTMKSKIPSKIIAVTPSLIIIEETYNAAQANTYTDYEPQYYSSKLQECQARYLINVVSDSVKSKLDIQTIVTCNLTYMKNTGKAVESISKQEEHKSIGIREKEILDYIAGKY